MSWIDELLLTSVEQEAPREFWYWSGLATISAVVKDNVFLSRGKAYNLYPNIYVMLLARSGMRKGPPINLAKQLVRRVGNTKIISGRSSIQAILKELSTDYTEEKGGRVISKAACFLVASEFSSSIVEDPAALTILTDLYDRNYNEGEYKSLLKSETFKLTNPIITSLVGTNEAHFVDFIAEKDVHGGYIGRTFVISARKKQRSNSLIDDLENPPVPEELCKHLIKLSKIKGQFSSLSKTAAGDYYTDWYTKLDEKVSEGDVEDKTGTLERIGDSVLKVAILLSLADDTDLVIEENHIAEAIEVCEKLIGNIRKVTMGKNGKSNYAPIKAGIIKELLVRVPHEISRIVLLKKLSYDLGAQELDDIMDSFNQAGVVKTINRGNVVVYEMPEKIVTEYTKFFSGRGNSKTA